jgi:hypothetical protein
MSDFKRIAFLDEPSLVGAQWWQDSVSSATGRRALAFAAIGVGVASVLGLGTCAVAAAVSGGGGASDDETTANRDALEMQRTYGWSFGNNGEPLQIAPYSALRDLEAAQADRLAAMRPPSPTDVRYQPYYAGALFEVMNATPKQTPSADTTAFTPFKRAYRGVLHTMLLDAYRTGVGIARLFAGAKASATALIVDMPGPEAVSLAAGATAVFSPVFMLQNWPHPKGVVKSHLALAAFAHFMSAFSDVAARPANAPPMFVLDSSRLGPIVDSVEDFDNRYRVTLPSVADLRRLGIAEVFVVGAASSADIAPKLSEYQAAGLAVRRLEPSEFIAGTSKDARLAVPDDLASWTQPELHFGGKGRELFEATYRQEKGTKFGGAHAWRPPTAPLQVDTAPIGVVPVVLAGGIIIGAVAARRRGTWARTLSGGGG